LVLDPERGHVPRCTAGRRGECATREHRCEGEEQNGPSIDQPPPPTAVFRNVKLRLSGDVLLQTQHLCFLYLRVQATPVPANSLAKYHPIPFVPRHLSPARQSLNRLSHNCSLSCTLPALRRGESPHGAKDSPPGPSPASPSTTAPRPPPRPERSRQASRLTA